MVPKNHACHTVAVGAPRAKNASRHSRVFWEFPSKCPERMVQWARFFCVLRHTHAALASNTVITKRDIYYRDPNLFQSQCRVDSMIVRICMTLSCTRASLNITASARSVGRTYPVSYHAKQHHTSGALRQGYTRAADPRSLHDSRCYMSCKLDPDGRKTCCISNTLLTAFS